MTILPGIGDLFSFISLSQVTMSDICWVRVIAGDIIGFLYASFYTCSVSNRQNSGEGIGKFLACVLRTHAFSSTALLAPYIQYAR
ncbi:hypothetical protein O997_04630 [Anaplasma phagocytophilum str. MRK]|nr:hypothetical protein O997_04630 [Anaplasma phagocytophilum str. MRK]